MTDEKNSIPSFYSGFLKLFSGLALAQILNLGFSLILPRYYSPEDYAFFGVFTAVLFILLEIITLKLEVTIFFPKEDKEALEIVHAIFFISFLFSLLVLAICIIVSFFYDPAYLLLAIALMMYGIALPLSAWFNRKGKYPKLNLYRIILALSTSMFSLIFIIVFHWHFGLVMGFILGQFFGLLYLITSFHRHLDIKMIKFSTASKYLRRYNQFPKYGILSSLTGSISRNSIVLVIKYFFGAINAGYYTMAARILNAPAGMYQSALSQVFVQQASRLANPELKIYTKRIVWFGFSLGIVPVVLLLFFGQSIFGFIFGIKWLMAGKITQYIVLWFFFQVLTGPVGFLLDIKQKLKFELNWNVVLFVFRSSAILTGIFLNDLYLMLLIVTVVSILMNLYLLRYILKLTNEKAN